jgi:anti-sigma B factor antagonist
MVSRNTVKIRGNRMLISRPVVVMQLPEQLDLTSARSFLQEVDPLMETHRPRIVLDCSQVRYVDGAGVEMLLHCLEEAMKRDGDLKLASVSPECAVIMEFLRVDRMFEVFPTPEDAVQSFTAFPAEAAPEDVPWYSAVFGGIGALKQAS